MQERQVVASRGGRIVFAANAAVTSHGEHVFPRLAHDLGGSPLRSVSSRSRRSEHLRGRDCGARDGAAGAPRRALDYLVLLANEAPDRYDRAARKWLTQLLAESPALTLNEVEVALGCLRGIAALYEEQSREVLRVLVKRRHEARGQ